MRKMIWAAALSALTLLGSGTPARAETRGPRAAIEAASQGPGPSQSPAAGVVNVNEATPEQLELLPGVGPSRAQAIVAFRKTHPFKRIEDLERIKGIGKKTLVRLRPLIALSGPTTLSQRPAPERVAQK